MAFIAQFITNFYDQQEDRISLIFNGNDEKQLKGNMTRQLFKCLLAQLPDWLAQQSRDAMPHSNEQQREINQIHHEASQQEATVTYGKVQPNEQLETFLINTISFTKVNQIENDQRIRLTFLGLNKTTKVIFVLNSNQLHKLINEMLKQVKVWDINNPWQEQNAAFALSDNKSGMLH